MIFGFSVPNGPLRHNEKRWITNSRKKELDEANGDLNKHLDYAKTFSWFDPNVHELEMGPADSRGTDRMYGVYAVHKKVERRRYDCGCGASPFGHVPGGMHCRKYR